MIDYDTIEFSESEKLKKLESFLRDDSFDFVELIRSFEIDYGVIDNDELPVSYIMIDDHFRRIVVNKAVFGDMNDFTSSYVKFISIYQLSFYLVHEGPILSIFDLSKIDFEVYQIAQKIYTSIVEKEQFHHLLQRKKGGK